MHTSYAKLFIVGCMGVQERGVIYIYLYLLGGLPTLRISCSISGELGGARMGAQQGPSRSEAVIECLPSLSELELQLPSSLSGVLGRKDDILEMVIDGWDGVSKSNPKKTQRSLSLFQTKNLISYNNNYIINEVVP